MINKSYVPVFRLGTFDFGQITSKLSSHKGKVHRAKNGKIVQLIYVFASGCKIASKAGINFLCFFFLFTLQVPSGFSE